MHWLSLLCSGACCRFDFIRRVPKSYRIFQKTHSQSFQDGPWPFTTLSRPTMYSQICYFLLFARSLAWLSVYTGLVATQSHSDKSDTDASFSPHCSRVASFIYILFTLPTLHFGLLLTDLAQSIYPLGHLFGRYSVLLGSPSWSYTMLVLAGTMYRFPRLASIGLFQSTPECVVYSHFRHHNAVSQPIHFTLVSLQKWISSREWARQRFGRKLYESSTHPSAFRKPRCRGIASSRTCTADSTASHQRLHLFLSKPGMCVCLQAHIHQWQPRRIFAIKSGLFSRQFTCTYVQFFLTLLFLKVSILHPAMAAPLIRITIGCYCIINTSVLDRLEIFLGTSLISRINFSATINCRKMEIKKIVIIRKF